MARYEADLHIHTLLSPCAEIEMIPSLIVEAAGRAGLDMIAVADHNSCENAGAVIEASEGSSVKVIPGLEVQSSEGVHLLCLFDDLGQAEAMQEAVYEALPTPPLPTREPVLSNAEGRDGVRGFAQEQMVVDARDEFVRYCEKPISLPASMSVDEVWERVNEIGGLLIPSHIDRIDTGLCGVLGMLPETPEFAGVEISANITVEQAKLRYRGLEKMAIFQSSDSHWLSAIGSHRTVLHVEHRSVAEIAKACRGEGGRRIGDA